MTAWLVIVKVVVKNMQRNGGVENQKKRNYTSAEKNTKRNVQRRKVT